MKASEVYREAAKQMELGYANFCCHALTRVGGYGLCAKMKKLYAPRSLSSAWMEDSDDGKGSYLGTESHNYRILALCFMAAIAEDEERSRKRRT